MPVQLERDDRLREKGEDRRRHPDYPMEPIFHAVAACTPDFDFTAIDLVTDKNQLRKLFDVCSGNDQRRPFRLNLSRIGRTILLTHADSDDEVAGQDCPAWARNSNELRYGYGYSFEKQFTKKQTDGTHRRITTFTLGDKIRLLVRHEVDAITDRAPESDEKTKKKLRSFAGSTLQVEEAGFFAPSADVYELKTKCEKYADEIRFDEIWAAMLLSGTKRLALALHTYGAVAKIRDIDVDTIEARVPDDKKNYLRRLVHLLNEIIDLLRRDHDNGLTLHFDPKENTDLLSVTPRTHYRELLPASVAHLLLVKPGGEQKKDPPE